MKTLFKLVMAVAVAVFVKEQFSGGKDFRKLGLLPLEVKFVQGEAPAADHPVLLEFWATWCGPCRQSIPHLNELYTQYHSRGLEVVGISDESISTVQGFMGQVPMGYPVAVDPAHRYARSLGIRGIPHAFLLDRTGKTVWDGHPMTLAAADLEKVLAR